MSWVLKIQTRHPHLPYHQVTYSEWCIRPIHAGVPDGPSENGILVLGLGFLISFEVAHSSHVFIEPLIGVGSRGNVGNRAVVIVDGSKSRKQKEISQENHTYGDSIQIKHILLFCFSGAGGGGGGRGS